MLSYDFLRLYINAFAFQANLNRIVRRSKKRPSGPLFSELAAAPDARFIYESIDAANSILCTLNSFIDPTEAFKYMPLKFYLYVIYAAVFLFKVSISSIHSGASLTIIICRPFLPEPSNRPKHEVCVVPSTRPSPVYKKLQITNKVSVSATLGLLGFCG